MGHSSRQLHLLERCLRRFDTQPNLIHWQMRLEALIAHLAPEYRSDVARHLQLSEDSIIRLDSLAQALDNVKNLTPCPSSQVESVVGSEVSVEQIRPSQVVQLLRAVRIANADFNCCAKFASN